MPSEPLDVILISGDMTDAGRSSEWVEFMDAVTRYPKLAERMLMIPGNHDLNIVDRANPARLDLPTSPNKRLRKLRVLSAMGIVQGERVHVVDRARGRFGGTLAQALTPHLGAMARFADTGRPIWSKELSGFVAQRIPDGAGARARRRARHRPARTRTPIRISPSPTRSE